MADDLDTEDMLVSRVRSALECADFDNAASLAREYAELACARMASAGSAEEQSSIVSAALARVRVWITFAKVMRSQFCAELTAASGQSSYCASLPAPNTLNLFG